MIIFNPQPIEPVGSTGWAKAEAKLGNAQPIEEFPQPIEDNQKVLQSFPIGLPWSSTGWTSSDDKLPYFNWLTEKCYWLNHEAKHRLKGKESGSDS